jgi:hypothetical protein
MQIGGAPQWRVPLAASWRKLTIGFYDERSSGLILRRMPAMKSIIMLATLALGTAGNATGRGLRLEPTAR